MTVLACIAEGCPAVRVLRIDLSACCKKQSGCFIMARRGRSHESIPAVFRVRDVRAAGEQVSDGGQVANLRRFHEVVG